MREGGLLDGFPLHLLTDRSDKATTLIIDSPDLGRLSLTPVPKSSKMIIALAERRECLDNAREAMNDLGGRRIHLVQADPKKLPFRNQSADVIVTLSIGKTKAVQSALPTGTSSTVPEDLIRILTNVGRLVEVTRTPNCRITREQKQHLWWAKAQTYYVRPASGRSYFVSQEWLPSSKLFKINYFGRLQSMIMRADLMISRLGIKAFYDSVSLLVHSKTCEEGVIEQLAGVTDSEGGGYGDIPCTQNSFGLFIKVGLNALLLRYKDTGTIVKFPLSALTTEMMKRHLDNLHALHAHGVPVVRSVLPRVVDQGILCGQAYWSEKKLDGVPATKFWWIPRWRKKTTESGLHFLIDLHRSTRLPTRILRSIFDELVEPHAATVENEARKLDGSFCISPLVEALWSVFRDREIPLVRTHGDFWPGNFLVSKNHQVTGVLDWDGSLERGWPMLDLVHLIAFQQKWRAIWYFGSVVSRRLIRHSFVQWEREMVEKYCAALAIEDNLWPSFVALYWLNRSSQCIGDFGETWVRRNVIKQLPRILKAVLAE